MAVGRDQGLERSKIMNTCCPSTNSKFYQYHFRDPTFISTPNSPLLNLTPSHSPRPVLLEPVRLFNNFKDPVSSFNTG